MSRKETIEQLRREVQFAEDAKRILADQRDAAEVSLAKCQEARRQDTEWRRSSGPNGDGRLFAPNVVIPPRGIPFLYPNDMRVPTLAISLMLRDRADALQVTTGAGVQLALAEYARADRLQSLLGEITSEEEAAALALWDETADADLGVGDAS